MKFIVAGSRDITDYSLVRDAIVDSGLWELYKSSKVDLEIVSGRASGVDTLGEVFADRNNLKWHKFPADWDNLNAPQAVIRTRRDGKKYNAKAGVDRNIKMGDFADTLVAIWDGESRGTKQMIEYMQSIGKGVYVHNLKTGKKGWLK